MVTLSPALATVAVEAAVAEACNEEKVLQAKLLFKNKMCPFYGRLMFFVIDSQSLSFTWS